MAAAIYLWGYNIENLSFSVDNDGCGVSKAGRLKIFEPFVRLDSSRQRGPGGTGLGLEIIKRIAEWHGGLVTSAPSNLGGTKFTISLTAML